MALNFTFLIYSILAMYPLISINSQGLRSDDCQQSAFNFFKRYKYDIIFIQETHWTDNKQLVIQQNWDGDIIFNHGTVNACGITILIHARLDFQLQQIKRDSHGRILAVKITIDDSVINLVNVYAPRLDTKRRSFFEQLENFLSCQHDNILGGDFNSIFDPRLDKLGRNPDARQSANKILLNIMSHFTLSDVSRERNKSHRNYTWTGRKPP